MKGLLLLHSTTFYATLTSSCAIDETYLIPGEQERQIQRLDSPSPRDHARALTVAWPTGSIFIGRCPPNNACERERERENSS